MFSLGVEDLTQAMRNLIRDKGQKNWIYKREEIDMKHFRKKARNFLIECPHLTIQTEVFPSPPLFYFPYSMRPEIRSFLSISVNLNGLII